MLVTFFFLDAPYLMLAINNGMQHLKKSLLLCYKVDVYYFNNFYYIHLPYLRLSLNFKIKPLSMQSKAFTRLLYELSANYNVSRHEVAIYVPGIPFTLAPRSKDGSNCKC